VQFIITDASFARSHAIHLSGIRLAMALLSLSLALMMLAAGLYHLVFLKGAREGWPVVGSLVKLVVRDEFEQRDRFLRENLDAMARKLGEMQAKLVQLEALGERVSGLAGLKPEEIGGPAGQGGPLISGRSLTIEELQATLADLDQLTANSTDLMTVVESRLIDQRIGTMMLPTQAPVQTGHLGSAFGWRIDPFTGRTALHTGLDFQAEPGTPVLAAAEVDHGNNLITRYAHLSRFWVKKGDLVKRGQKIAEVGTTGRSTGPHLHFEVLVQGVPQDPGKFLAAGRAMGTQLVAHAGSPRLKGRTALDPPTGR
jgi:hypothetical protein